MSEFLNDSPADSATPTPPPSNPAQGQPADGGGGWLASLPEELKGLAEHKGWKEPGEALRSYKSLEEYMGADKAERGVVLPKDSEDTEAFDKIYKALGRPDEAGGYELNSLFGEDQVDENFLGAMSKTMHEAGLSKAQAHKMGAAYQEMYKAAQAEAEAHYAGEVADVKASLPPATVEEARRGFRLLRLPPDEAAGVSEALERALGPKAAVELFARLGQAAGEDRPIDGATGVGGRGNATEERERLLSDKAFHDRYMQGDPGAMARIEGLNIRIAEQNK